jgi:hypothetical protein
MRALQQLRHENVRPLQTMYPSVICTSFPNVFHVSSRAMAHRWWRCWTCSRRVQCWYWCSSIWSATFLRCARLMIHLLRHTLYPVNVLSCKPRPVCVIRCYGRRRSCCPPRTSRATCACCCAACRPCTHAPSSIGCVTPPPNIHRQPSLSPTHSTL